MPVSKLLLVIVMLLLLHLLLKLLLLVMLLQLMLLLLLLLLIHFLPLLCLLLLPLLPLLLQHALMHARGRPNMPAAVTSSCCSSSRHHHVCIGRHGPHWVVRRHTHHTHHSKHFRREHALEGCREAQSSRVGHGARHGRRHGRRSQGYVRHACSCGRRRVERIPREASLPEQAGVHVVVRAGKLTSAATSGASSTSSCCSRASSIGVCQSH